MRADLDNPSAIKHDQPIHGRDRRQAVRYGDHGFSFHQSVEGFLDCRFDLGNRARWWASSEHQYRGVLQEHPGDRYALPLAAGELHATFADMRVIAAATF